MLIFQYMKGEKYLFKWLVFIFFKENWYNPKLVFKEFWTEPENNIFLPGD